MKNVSSFETAEDGSVKKQKSRPCGKKKSWRRISHTIPFSLLNSIYPDSLCQLLYWFSQAESKAAISEYTNLPGKTVAQAITSYAMVSKH